MRIKIMEKDPARLRAMAEDFGVKVPQGQTVEMMQIAIASAYLNEINAETRRAMRVKKLKDNLDW